MARATLDDDFVLAATAEATAMIMVAQGARAKKAPSLERTRAAGFASARDVVSYAVYSQNLQSFPFSQPSRFEQDEKHRERAGYL